MLSTNLHAWPFILEARKKGAKIVVIDPMRTRTAKQADWHIPIKPGDGRGPGAGHDERDHRRGLGRPRLRGEIHAGLRRAEGAGRGNIRQSGSHRSRAFQPRTSASSLASTQPPSLRRSARAWRSSVARAAVMPFVPITCAPGAGRRLAACGRRYRRDADLGVPVQLRFHLPARLDQARHACRQRARSRRRTYAASCHSIRRLKSLFVYNSNPVSQAPNASQDRPRAEAGGSVHGRERALHDGYGTLCRHHPARYHAGRAVRPHGDLGASLRDAQPAGDLPRRASAFPMSSCSAGWPRPWASTTITGI